MALRGKQTDGSILSINTPVRPAPGASYDALGESIRSVGNPSATPAIGATSAATPRSIAWKQPVRLATEGVPLPGYTWAAGVAGDGELTAIANGALSIDSVPVAIGDRVLVKDETGGNAPYNGLYIVGNPGDAFFQFVLVRAPDAASNGGLIPGIACNVVEGTVNAATEWMLETPAPIALNVTALSFVAPGGTVAVNTIAALSLLDVSAFGDGTQVYVRSVRSLFILRIGVFAPNGITVAAALGGTKTWFRSNDVHYSWDATLNWYIDAVAGDDENAGDTNLVPIQTLEELTRRTYRPNNPRPDYNLFVLAGGAGGAGAVFTTNCNVTVTGTQTELAAPVAITVANARVVTPYAAQNITAAISWVNSVFLKTRTAPNVIDQTGWKTHAIAGDNNATSFANTPLLTDTVAEYALASLEGSFTCVGNYYLDVTGCAVNGTFTDANGVYLNDCTVSIDAYRCTFSNLANCYITSLDIHECFDFQITDRSVIKGEVRIYDSTALAQTCIVDSDAASGTAGFDLFAETYLRVTGLTECRQCAAAFNVKEPSATADIDISAAAADLFGGSNDYALLIDVTNAVMTYQSAAAFNDMTTILGQFWSHSDGAGGFVSGAHAALPSVLQLPTRLVGIFPRV